MWIVINLKWFRCPSGFNEHSGHPAPSPFSTANGVFPRKSPPISTQNPNHMTSHVTSLPSSIGRLSLGLASHFAASPIPEQDDNIHSPVGSSKYNQCDFCLPILAWMIISISYVRLLAVLRYVRGWGDVCSLSKIFDPWATLHIYLSFLILLRSNAFILGGVRRVSGKISTTDSLKIFHKFLTRASGGTRHIFHSTKLAITSYTPRAWITTSSRASGRHSDRQSSFVLVLYAVDDSKHQYGTFSTDCGHVMPRCGNKYTWL